MKNYDFNKIDKLVQPLMTMLQEEFPNSCKLIIEPHFARIVYEHDEMIFQSDKMKNLQTKTPLFIKTNDFTDTLFGVM